MINIERKIRKAEYLAETGYDLRSIEYIAEAYNIFKISPVSFAFVALIQVSCIAYARFYLHSTLVYLLAVWLTFPLNIGYGIVARKIKYGEDHSFSNFFDAYKRFLPLLAVHILGLIIISAGLICLILPGIYLSVCFSLSSWFLWFLNDGQIFESLKRSCKLIARQWGSFFGFVLLNALVVAGGALFLGVGLLAALPITNIAMYLCFEDLIGTDEEEENEPNLPVINSAPSPSSDHNDPQDSR